MENASPDQMVPICMTIFVILFFYYNPSLWEFLCRTFSRKRGTLPEEEEEGKLLFNKEDRIIVERQVKVYVVDMIALFERRVGRVIIESEFEMVDGKKRRANYRDCACARCGETIYPSYKRVFHANGAECYGCYRGRINSKISHNWFLLKESAQELNWDVLYSILRLYSSFYQQEDIILMFPCTFPIIPERCLHMLSLFPSLPYPRYFVCHKMMQFHFPDPDSSLKIGHYFDFYFGAHPKHIKVIYLLKQESTGAIISQQKEIFSTTFSGGLRFIEEERFKLTKA